MVHGDPDAEYSRHALNVKEGLLEWQELTTVRSGKRERVSRRGWQLRDHNANLVDDERLIERIRKREGLY